jgi:hypothetical protein
MSKNFSYSRVSTFNTCKLKYKFQYYQEIKAEGVDRKLADKGNAIHLAFEKYVKGDTVEKIMQYVDENIAKYKLNKEDYNYQEAVERFIEFQQSFMEPKIESGFKVYKEMWARSTFCSQPFIGALDTVLISNEEIIIVDFKSAKSAKTDSYQTQLLIYAYLLGKDRNWSYEEITNKIKVYVFFPLADIGKRASLLPVHDRMTSVLKQIVYNEITLQNTIQTLEKDIEKILAIDWNSINENDAEMSYVCQFCDFRGAIPDPKINFIGCPLTYAAGIRQSRKTKYYI